jgi:hypothetical protein
MGGWHGGEGDRAAHGITSVHGRSLQYRCGAESSCMLVVSSQGAAGPNPPQAEPPAPPPSSHGLAGSLRLLHCMRGWLARAA